MPLDVRYYLRCDWAGCPNDLSLDVPALPDDNRLSEKAKSTARAGMVWALIGQAGWSNDGPLYFCPNHSGEADDLPLPVPTLVRGIKG